MLCLFSNTLIDCTGEGFPDEENMLDARLFKEMVEAQEMQIVRRVCPTCSASHRDIYYRRLTGMPDDFDLLDTLMNNWFDTDNKLDVDFALYSTYLDAYYDTNRWTFCNFNDPGIGFPRDCGPYGQVNSNWNSYYRGGGKATQHAFLLPANPSFSSQLSNIAKGKPTTQQGLWNGGVSDRAVDGNTVGIYNWGSTTATGKQDDPFWLVELEHNSTIDKVYFWGCISGCGRLSDVRIDVYDTLYGDVVASRLVEGTAKVMNVVDFGGVVGQVVSITRETAPGSPKHLHLAEVQIEGSLGAAVSPRLFAEIDADEYNSQSGIRLENDGTTIGYFDNGDYMTYESVNFGPSGTTKSILFNYAKANRNGRMEIRLGGVDGELIGEFVPSNTGGWHTYVDAYVNIKDVEGVHDVTFVGRDVNGVLNLKRFALTDKVALFISTDYKVDDNNGRDTQCRYEVLLDAFQEQVYNLTYSGSSTTLDAAFFSYLSVSDEASAINAVDTICKAAQDTIEEE